MYKILKSTDNHTRLKFDWYFISDFCNSPAMKYGFKKLSNEILATDHYNLLIRSIQKYPVQPEDIQCLFFLELQRIKDNFEIPKIKTSAIRNTWSNFRHDTLTFYSQIIRNREHKLNVITDNNPDYKFFLLAYFDFYLPIKKTKSIKSYTHIDALTDANEKYHFISDNWFLDHDYHQMFRQWISRNSSNLKDWKLFISL